MPTVRDVVEDLAVTGIAGYVGTKAMEPVSMALYERESEHAKQQENAARPGLPYQIAATKIAGKLGVDLHGGRPGPGVAGDALRPRPELVTAVRGDAPHPADPPRRGRVGHRCRDVADRR